MSNIKLYAEVRTKEGRFVATYLKTNYDFGFEAYKDQPVFASDAIKKVEKEPTLKKILTEYPSDSLTGGKVKTICYLFGEINDEREWTI